MSNQCSPSYPCEVLLFTAQPEEYNAVLGRLQNVQEILHPEGTVYECGTFPARNSHWRVMVAEIGIGGLTAAIEAERAISFCRPQVALYVGVAKGLKDVNPGDVVAATKVYAYETGEAAETFKVRPVVWPSSYVLEQRARSVARKEEWLSCVDTMDFPFHPRAYIGALASGEKMLESVQSSLFALLKTHYSDTLAVEMAGHGFLQAVHAHQYVYSLVVRGIAHVLDDQRVLDIPGIQEKAAHHAAAFAFQILANLALPLPDTATLVQKPVYEYQFPEPSNQKETTGRMLDSDVPSHSLSVRQISQQMQRFFFSRSAERKRWSRSKWLLSITILLILGVSIVRFSPFLHCPFSCHLSPLSTQKPLSQDLSVALVDIVSPSVVFSDRPESPSLANIICAVLLGGSPPSSCTIIIAVQNIRLGGGDILIDYLALKLLSIPITPRPLKVQTLGIAATYDADPYPVIYKGQLLKQLPNQLLYTTPSQDVILRPASNRYPGESNQLALKVMSTVDAYLLFQVQIAYQLAGTTSMLIKTLPQTFQAVFSDASNWQEYPL